MDSDTTITDDDKSKMSKTTKTKKTEGFGEQLRKTRESLDLTVKEAAARLYLTPRVIELIEAEKFAKGPPATFMRGYIRSYAKLLGFSDSDIKNAIESLDLPPIFPPSEEDTPAPLAKPTPVEYEKYIGYGTYAVAAILIALVFMWWKSHSKTPTITPLAESSISSTTAANDPEEAIIEPEALSQPIVNVSLPKPVTKPIEPIKPAISTEKVELLESKISTALEDETPKKPNTDAINSMVIPEP